MTSHKSAVVIIPSRACWDQIQRIRRKHDKAYMRWMPHINLLYPFIPDSEDNFQEAVGIMTKTLADVRPFTIRFTDESFGKFVHGRNSTVMLKPICEELKSAPEDPKDSKRPPRPPLPSYNPSPEAWERAIRRHDHARQEGMCNRHKETGKPDRPPPPSYNQGHGGNTQHKHTQQASGLDALKSAYWTPDGTAVQSQTKEPSIDNLKFAFVGDESLCPKATGVNQDKNERTNNSSAVTDTKHEALETDIGQHTRNDDATESDENQCTQSDDVIKLQAELEALYPQCNDLSSKSPAGFQPHLTLGQQPADSADAFIKELQLSWKDQTFPVNEVCIISRDDSGNLPFDIKHRVPLGQTSTSGHTEDAAVVSRGWETSSLSSSTAAYVTPARTDINQEADQETQRETTRDRGNAGWRGRGRGRNQHAQQRVPNIRSKAEFPALGKK